MIGMSPKDAIKLKKVSLVESYPLEGTLHEDGLHYYLLQPREEHDDHRKEQQIGYGLRRLTDCAILWQTLAVG